MNHQPRKNGSLLTRGLGLIFFVIFCNTAAAIDSAVKADAAAQPNIECVLNWAQTFYPNLFSPLVSGVQSVSTFTYRYYPNTNAYVGFSSADNHIYYLGPNDVSPQDQGDISVWLKESGCGAVLYPVIFIHGIASSADTWIPYRNYLINNATWIFGGIPTYNQVTKTTTISCPVNPSQPVSCTGNAGDFYTLNFSDNQGLSFDVQGGELAAIIKAVLDANPGKTQVLLISHSMGGLAAREYLQGLARELNAVTTIPYRGDAVKLISVGTPHQGSFLADACHNSFDILNISGNIGICSLLPVQIDQNSIAIQDLQPNSPALNVLNDLTTHPLPANVSYVSIIGTGQPTLSGLINFTTGDGLVSDASQDLLTITGNLPLQQKSVKINIPLRGCGNQIDIPSVGNVGETHTCETTDQGVGAEILRDLQ
ncbi:MAG: esterase/lipase family protein [Methylobacter sp.]